MNQENNYVVARIKLESLTELHKRHPKDAAELEQRLKDAVLEEQRASLALLVSEEMHRLIR